MHYYTVFSQMTLRPVGEIEARNRLDALKIALKTHVVPMIGWSANNNSPDIELASLYRKSEYWRRMGVM